ncbi:hypothetical protein [Nocardioides limicola]|uniref:hypothetical protein n=1 Tax=Nocardioides limicola TaxID=2803368 RepID=UPI00193AF4C7|nr:hypothetical protein [Nocardioides sp. DJM-14]
MTNSNEQKFSVMLADIKADEGNYDAFIKEPLVYLQKHGVDLVAQEDLTPPGASVLANSAATDRGVSLHAALAESEQLTVSWDWWGVTFTMNDTLCKDIAGGGATMATLSGLAGTVITNAGLVTGGLATVAGAAIAAVLIIKAAEITLVNNGNGVYFPISWVQWAPIIAMGGVTGPALIAAAALIHPIRL